MILFVSAVIALNKNNIWAEEGRKCAIVMAPNDEYVGPTMVALTSMFENAGPKTFYDVNLLTSSKSFNAHSKMKMYSLKEKYKKFPVSITDVGDLYGGVYARKNLPTCAYYRLSISSIFPDLKKCIYLDGDVIVRHDLLDMYNINIDDYYCAGCRDKPFDEERLKLLEIPNSNQIINSGVLILNLENMRKNKVEEKFWKAIEEKKEIIRKYTQDQDVINLVCYGRILLLPEKFNAMVNIPGLYSFDWEKKDPVIVHFSWYLKPWKYPKRTVYHKEFWKYARMTIFFAELREKNMRKNSKRFEVERKRKRNQKITKIRRLKS